LSWWLPCLARQLLAKATLVPRGRLSLEALGLRLGRRKPRHVLRRAEAREECWICREDGSSEPLIQPCACRGSMSGVHASCVEAWISHHRTNALGDEAPRCSVCNQPYSGTERRPGVAGFAWHVCGDFARQVARSATLVGLLVAYWTAAQPGLVFIWIRVLLFAGSGSFFLHKAVVLSVSLPRGHLPPQNCCRRFYTDDFRLVAMHIAEMMAIVIIAALWCLYGQLHYYFFVPLGVVALLPLVSMLLRQQGSPCSLRSLTMVAIVLASPLILLVYVGHLILEHPKRLANPCDGLLHVFVPLTAIPLCWFCTSNIPVLVLWGVHSLVLIAGLLERFAVRKMAWKEGRIWWAFLQLSVLATYIANLLHNFSEGFLKDDSSWLILGVSLTWLILSCTLALWVNWGLCVQQYRLWQHRNGSFTISPASSPTNAAPQTIGATSEGTAVVPGGAAAGGRGRPAGAGGRAQEEPAEGALDV